MPEPEVPTAQQRVAAIHPPDRAVTATAPIVRPTGRPLRAPLVLMAPHAVVQAGPVIMALHAVVQAVPAIMAPPAPVQVAIRRPPPRHEQHLLQLEVLLPILERQEPAPPALRPRPERQRLRVQPVKRTASLHPRIHQAVRLPAPIIQLPPVQVPVPTLEVLAAVVVAAPMVVEAVAALLAEDAGKQKYRFK